MTTSGSELPPLELPARRTEVVEGPARRRPLVRAALWAVQRLPTVRDTRSGRASALRFKGAGVLLGLTVAILGGSLETALAGVLLLVAAPALPVAEGRKLRWTTAFKRLLEPARRLAERPLSVQLADGKLTVRDEGRVWRGVNVRAEHLRTVLRVDGRVTLALSPPSGRNAETVWLVCDGAPPGDLDLSAIDETRSPRAVPPVLLTGPDWATLYDTLLEPERRRQRRRERKQKR